MANSQRVEDRRPDLSDVTCQAARAQLRPSCPAQLVERRELSTRRALVRRVHSECPEMPGLTLSLEQAARLFSFPSSVCARVFAELIKGDLLRRTTDGRYALAKRSAWEEVPDAERNYTATKNTESQECGCDADDVTARSR